MKDVRSAWARLGYSFDAVMTELAALPRESRVQRAREMLDGARRRAKSLMASAHPDRGGNPVEFRDVSESLKSIEASTDEFERKMKKFMTEHEIAAMKKVFIVKELGQNEDHIVCAVQAEAGVRPRRRHR